jgi:hypothetical protein
MFPGVDFKAPKNFKLEDVSEELDELDEINFNEYSKDRKPTYIEACRPRGHVTPRKSAQPEV